MKNSNESYYNDNRTYNYEQEKSITTEEESHLAEAIKASLMLDTQFTASESFSSSDVYYDNDDNIYNKYDGGDCTRIESNSDRKRPSSTKTKTTTKESKEVVIDEAKEEEEEKKGPSSLLLFSFFLLFLEFCGALLAIIYWDNVADVVECCGESYMSNDTWNVALFVIATAYLTWTIVSGPIIAKTHEPFFLFNPMIGFLLAMHMLYTTHVVNAYIMYGIETFAMLGQTYVLCQIRKRWELSIHTLANYTVSLLMIFMITSLSNDGGYCIVDGELQSIFSNSTCSNAKCTDEVSCNICTGEINECFISFS
jgi:hypothetical protein